MIKVCSLDFLNDKCFEKDILSETGKVILSAGEKVTPESLLKLYYRNIYVQNPINATKADVQRKPSLYNTVATYAQSEHIGTKENNSFAVASENVAVTDNPIKKIDIPEQISQQSTSEQDDYFYAKIIEYSVKLGEISGFSEDELKELENIAYYYLVSEAGESVPEEMETSVEFCYRSYKSNRFSLNEKIPYAHIIFIVAYYIKALKANKSEQETILEMLRYGNNKFNPFVLHKFLNIMRNG